MLRRLARSFSVNTKEIAEHELIQRGDLRWVVRFERGVDTSRKRSFAVRVLVPRDPVVVVGHRNDVQVPVVVDVR